MISQTDEITRLARENSKLKKINAALMSRVERAMDQPANAFSLFEAAIALDKMVRRRTDELQAALRSIERSNDALKNAKLRADQANSFKSTFLAFVSHDLLQPLNAARLSLSALMEIETSATSAPLVHQVDRALVSLEDLIRTLLDISKLDAGVMRPDICVFEIERVIGPLRLEFESLAAVRGLKLHVRESKEVIRSDPLMLRRILQNLLNNALRYTRRGGVLLGCRKRGGNLRIEIIDTGPGIPADRRGAIFEEFQRDAAATAEHCGFGLGLSIVRRLALALEHPIDLASRVGHGSVFAITAPLDDAVNLRPVAAVHSSVQMNYGVDAASVMLVENEPSVAKAMKDLLERWGCGVVTASSGVEARDAIRARQQKPDLIIADLHLDNGERGFDAIGIIQRDMDVPVPAFILTADHSEGATAEAAARGVEILRKPVRPAELRSLMAYLLG
jgi:signal transduction histidine kinase/CheY-like chemotaxis protein